MIEKLKSHAESRGGKLLSTVYINETFEYEWQDSKGRKFKKPWLNVRDYNSWSPYEAKENQLKANVKYGMDYCSQWCSDRNWKFLSTSYTNDKATYEYENEKGEYFTGPWKDVVSGKRTGPDRRGQHRNKFTLETAKEWASSKGAILHATEWKGIEYTYYFTDRNGDYFNQQFKTCIKNDDVLYVDSSRGQAEIADFLKQSGLSIKENDRSILEGKELDIVCGNLAIEYHGLRWHTTKGGKISKTYHEQKMLECREKGVQLLQVFEHEWKNRKPQVKGYLQSKLGLNSLKIGARKCDLRVVPKKQALQFLRDYHIQGVGINNTYCYGLYYQGDLVMMITIGKHHRGNPELVLHRCVAKHGVTVSGGLSRLCKHAKSIHGVYYTFVDLRWSTGDSWIKNGWQFDKDVALSYFYYNINNKDIKTKQSVKKHKNEVSYMESQGYYQVWDAGKIKLRF
jgi:hypothetical protein